MNISKPEKTYVINKQEKKPMLELLDDYLKNVKEWEFVDMGLYAAPGWADLSDPDDCFCISLVAVVGDRVAISFNVGRSAKSQVVTGDFDTAKQVIDIAVEIQDWWNGAFVKKEEADVR